MSGERQGKSADAPRRVLVVDDAEGIRSYLATLLELRGFAVDTAEDGRSALALLDAGASPNVVILDVMMPGMDGLETLRQIRERDPR
ncbi:MAG: response regulator, partial [Proteobacteria bacterium]|nr:response regulator [Pseudomonadota bacterium]